VEHTPAHLDLFRDLGPEPKTLIALARTQTEPDQIVALATRCGHGGVGAGHYCEFYIAAANRLASTDHIDKGRAVMQAGMARGHVTWPQMAAWEDFAKYTAENPPLTEESERWATSP